MKIPIPIPIPILSVAVTAAIVTTACSAPPVIHDSGPSPSPTFNNEQLHSCDDGTEIPGFTITPCLPTSAVDQLEHDRALAARAQLDRAGKLGVPPGVDLDLAEAAQRDHVPFAFGLDTGGCAWLRLADGTLWSLNGEGGALSRDVDRENLFRTTPGAQVTVGCTTRGVASIPVSLDRAAADAANAEGRPWRWSDGCKSFVRIGGQTYWLPDSPTVRGSVLSTEVLGYGCNSGVERPGGNR